MLGRLHRLLEEHPFPQDGRISVVGRGARLGLTSDPTEQVYFGPWEALAVYINQLVTEALRAAARKASWTSIQVNVDTIAAAHRDNGTTGVSLILLAGSFSGGAFLCDNLMLRDTGYVLAFDGNIPHQSAEFSGRRFSVVLHTVRQQGPLATQVSEHLKRLQFPVPLRNPGDTLRATQTHGPPFRCCTSSQGRRGRTPSPSASGPQSRRLRVTWRSSRSRTAVAWRWTSSGTWATTCRTAHCRWSYYGPWQLGSSRR